MLFLTHFRYPPNLPSPIAVCLLGEQSIVLCNIALPSPQHARVLGTQPSQPCRSARSATRPSLAPPQPALISDGYHEIVKSLCSILLCIVGAQLPLRMLSNGLPLSALLHTVLYCARHVSAHSACSFVGMNATRSTYCF
jgi:hypothetical protein